MRKGKSVIGQDIISYNDGSKVGAVKDLIIGPDNENITALLSAEGGLLSSARAVAYEHIVSFGKDAVVIADARAVMPTDNLPEVDSVMSKNEKLLGKKVFTETGDEHGTVDDVFFDEQSGQILGYEVGGGLFKNVQRGTSYLPLEDIVNIGPDVVLIRPDAAEDLEAQVGGVQGALQTAGDKVGDVAGNIGQAAKDQQLKFVEGKTAATEVRADDGSLVVPQGGHITAEIAQHADHKGKLAQLVASAGGGALQSIGAGIQGNAEDAAVGKRAAQTVESDHGGIIVASGQRVTRAQVKEAKEHDKLAELLAAVGLGQAQAGGQQAGAALGQAGDTAGQVAGQAADKAGDLWETFTQKISGLTDASGKRIDEAKTKQQLSKIQDAVGRPVTKVILDRQDNVILNLGDIITHHAVQSAYDAGTLDSLLDSVYKGDVEFSKEEMRADQEGEATVEKSHGEAPVIDQMEQKLDQAKQERDQQKEQKQAEAEQKKQEKDAASRDDQEDKQPSGQAIKPAVGADAAEHTEVVYKSNIQDLEPSSQQPGRAGTVPTQASTEPHPQASIPNEQFHSSGDTQPGGTKPGARSGGSTRE